MRILFWNVRGNQTTASVIRQIAEAHDIQVVCVAEAPEDPSWLVTDLAKVAPFRPASLSSTRLQVFGHDALTIRERLRHGGDRYVIASIEVPHRNEDVTLAVAHLPSKLRQNLADQVTVARGLAESIREVEDRLGHRRTVLIGDLNSHPFEEPVARVDTLNGVMSQVVARRGTREFDYKSYPFFYNPMWSRLGDLSSGRRGRITTRGVRQSHTTGIAWINACSGPICWIRSPIAAC